MFVTKVTCELIQPSKPITGMPDLFKNLLDWCSFKKIVTQIATSLDSMRGNIMFLLPSFKYGNGACYISRPPV